MPAKAKTVHLPDSGNAVWRPIPETNIVMESLKESGLFINLFFNYFGHAVRLVGCEFSDQRLSPCLKQRKHGVLTTREFPPTVLR